jgi:hypothetical protein
MSQEITLMQTFAMVECCECHVAFAMPSVMNRELLESRETFYCPNGHGQQYAGETSAQKAERALQAERQMHTQTQHLLAQAKADTAKLQRRISAGACPCCNRNFQNLQLHMKTKHAQFSAIAAGGKKALPVGKIQ